MVFKGSKWEGENKIFIGILKWLSIIILLQNLIL